MALKGDLASVDLAQMFQMLALNKKAGLLSIQSPRLWQVLYFDARGVTLYYNPHALLDRAIGAFVRAERLRPEVVEELRAHASRNRVPLQDAVLAGGYLSEADLTGQMRFELEEEIYDLFFCKDARFEFHEGVDQLEGREGVVDGRFFFHTDSVIMEAARRIDEWSYISERIQGALEVFCPSDQEFRADEVDEFAAMVFGKVDGCRSVARIVELTGLPKFTVFKALSQLVDAGFIVPLPPEDLIPLGSQCVDQGRMLDAVQLFEKAIDLGIGVPTVHSLAAEAWRALERYEQASRHLQQDAEHRIGDGDCTGAVERLVTAVQLVPTDLAARERLVKLVLEQDLRVGGFDPIASGKELVELLLSVGESARARAVLEHLVRARPDDLELKKALVNVHSKAGDQQRVCELYASMADDLVRQHRPLEAIACLQKVLMIDRSRSDVSERLRVLYAMDERSRRRRRTLVGLGILAVLLVGLGITWQYYDGRADADFAQVDVAAMIAAGDYEQAEAEYRHFITEHPLATASARASEQITRIAGLRLEREASLAAQRATRDRQLAALRQDYRAEWRRYADLFREGKPEAALASVEQVRKLVAEAGQQDDHAWALEEQVENTHARLSGFLARAAELRQGLDAELAAGRIERARQLAVELVSGFEITAAAKDAVLPVRVLSRPLGALIFCNGQPLTTTVDGVEQPLRTPAVVHCSRASATFELRLDGFVATAVAVDPRRQAAVEAGLEAVPLRRLHFDAPVRALGMAGGAIVAALRTGPVVIASAATGAPVRTIELGSLRELDGEPLVHGGRVWFATNENSLECFPLDGGPATKGWPVALAQPLATPLAARDGRLVFVDRANRLWCLDQGGGRPLWQHALDSAPVGPPVMEPRIVRVTSTDGSVREFDTTDGRVIRTVRLDASASSRVFAGNGMWWWFGSDARLHAYDVARGAESWSVPTGRVVADGEAVWTDAGIVALLGDATLVRFGLGDGAQQATWRLTGAPASPLRATGNRVWITTRLREGREKPRDVLTVLDAGSLQLRYEFAPQGQIADAVAADDIQAVVGPDGDVVLLR